MSDRSIYLAPAKPEHAMTLLRGLVGVLMIAAGVCLGMLGAFEADRIIHADEYAVDVE